MQHKKIIQSEIEFNKTFRYITQAYEEIAVLKMRKVRSSVLSTRDYLSHLAGVFYELKREKDKIKKNKIKAVIEEKKFSIADVAKKLEQTDEPNKIKRTASVLLSANTSLYGDLIQRIFNLFIKNVSKDGSDIFIVGRLGKRLYDEQNYKKPYLYFEIPDFDIRLEELKPIIFNLIKYQKITVYHGKFDTLLNQLEVASDISGDLPYAFKKDAKNKPEVTAESHFLFEPDITRILSIFEDLISSSLLRQTVHETQLARWASRILSMEKAQANIDLSIKKLNFSRTKLQKQDDNQKQLNRLAGLSLWRR